ncbi:hypothetical protein B9Z52_10745 [Limnohabitans sp. Jir72]|nr:hypothetical protein B9Z52_10745 [Limnohabitans sp. Jir72]
MFGTRATVGNKAKGDITAAAPAAPAAPAAAAPAAPAPAAAPPAAPAAAPPAAPPAPPAPPKTTSVTSACAITHSGESVTVPWPVTNVSSSVFIHLLLLLLGSVCCKRVRASRSAPDSSTKPAGALAASMRAAALVFCAAAPTGEVIGFVMVDFFEGLRS